MVPDAAFRLRGEGPDGWSNECRRGVRIRRRRRLRARTRSRRLGGWRRDVRLHRRRQGVAAVRACGRRRPGQHRRHPDGPAASGRRARHEPRLRQARGRQPDRLHEGPDGESGDRSRRAGRSITSRRQRGRVHRWLHRDLAGARLCGQGLPAPHRHVGRVQPGEARSSGRPRRARHPGPERSGSDHGATRQDDDRDRSGNQPGHRCVVVRSAQQPRWVHRL